MTIRAHSSIPGTLLVLLACSMLTAGSASAMSPVAKDGKIHACYKAKGKGKGTLRVVRNGKARCPKKWKKVSWYASGRPGSAGTQGQPGAAGTPGANGQPGERGLPGTAGVVVVEDLEKQVKELLTKVQSLESVLQGVTNAGLKEAIAAVPVVEALCTQADALTDQSNGLGTALSGLSAVVDTLTAMGLPPVPAALPPFECP
jgi:hypothetical protein